MAKTESEIRGKIYRFPGTRDHIEIFIDYDLIEIIEEIYPFERGINIIYTPLISQEFVEGIDFYLTIKEKSIPFLLTDDEIVMKSFREKGIETIFIPEKNNEGEPLYPLQKRKIVKGQIKKIMKKFI